ncbi:MAG: hypothetical protein K2M76_07335 [Muribaculaceae bacterium]|nr:hypothetical protein [Muribaculaceae bacterium]
MTEYWVVITLSHNTISFQYNRVEGEDKLLPFAGGRWPAPLAVYNSDSGLKLGYEAMSLVEENSPNAYFDIFRLIAGADTFMYYGERKSINTLLLYAVEEELSRFLSRSLYGQYGDLEQNRSDMALRFMFEDDVTGEERGYVLNLFRRGGYANVAELDVYADYLEYARERYSYRHCVMVGSNGRDITIKVYRLANGMLIGATHMSGMGQDPRVMRIADKIWGDILDENPWADRAAEEKRLMAAAAMFLHSGKAETEDTIVLSDGQTYEYSVSRDAVNRMSGGDDLAQRVSSFLRDTGVNLTDAMVIMRGFAAGNEYYRGSIIPGFRAVIDEDENVADEIGRRMVRRMRNEQPVSPSPVVQVMKPEPDRPTPTPKPEPVRRTIPDPIQRRQAAPQRIVISNDDNEEEPLVVNVSVPQPRTSTIDGRAMLEYGDFEGAKKWYEENDPGADAIKHISAAIRGKKNFNTRIAALQQVQAAGNKAMALMAMTELNIYASALRKLNLDASQVMDLSDAYKAIAQKK